VIAFALAVSSLSFAQDTNRPKSNSKRTVIEQLHPKLVETKPPEGIILLAGYKHRAGMDFEGNQVGEISKPARLKIKYEMGFSQGLAVDPVQETTYVWYREQKVNGRLVRYALNKSNVLIISVSLSDELGTLHAANFYGAIRRPDDIADMLLMVVPFAQSYSMAMPFAQR
jgi:hypothetical protein